MPHRSETNGIAERALRRNKGGNVCCIVSIRLGLKWWVDSVECYCYLRNVQDLLADGENALVKGDSENHVKAPSFRLVQWLNIVRSLQETSQGSIKLVSFTWNIPRTCVDREEIWKGHIMMADIEEMENLDSAEIHPRRLNATEVLTPQRRGKLSDSKPQMKQLNCLEETAEFENPLGGANNL